MSANKKTEEANVHEPQILRLDGALDLERAQLLATSIDGLVERDHIHIALDFTRVDIVSSSAVRVLIEKTKALQDVHGKLVLFSVHADVIEILKLAGFEKLLNIFPLEGEALSALNS